MFRWGQGGWGLPAYYSGHSPQAAEGRPADYDYAGPGARMVQWLSKHRPAGDTWPLYFRSRFIGWSVWVCGCGLPAEQVSSRAGAVC